MELRTALALRWLLICVAVVFVVFAAAQAPTELGMGAIASIVIIIVVVSGPISLWLVGGLDTFDPIALLCLFAMHFFVFSPLYQVCIDYYPYLPWDGSLERWVPIWFESQAMWFVPSLLIANWVSVNRYENRFSIPRSDTKRWNYRVDPAHAKRVASICFMLLCVSFAAKLLILWRLDGLGGLLAAYQERIDLGVTRFNPLAGVGALVFIADAAPVLLTGFLVFRQLTSNGTLRSRWIWWTLLWLLPLTFLYVGLIGSRSNTVYSVFMIVCLMHSTRRTVSPLGILVGGVLLVSFMSAYLAYKFGGIEAVFDQSVKRAAFEQRQLADPLDFLLVRDFGRMDVQVLAMREVFAFDYPPAMGRSYLSGLLSVVPTAIFPGRPETFSLEKTEIIYPNKTLDGETETTLVFGAFGEAIVNFRWASLILALPFGYFVGLCAAHYRSSRLNDRNALLVPVLPLLPIAMLVYDSNSLMYFLVQFALMPLLLLLILQRTRIGCQASDNRIS